MHKLSVYLNDKIQKKPYQKQKAFCNKITTARIIKALGYMIAVATHRLIKALRYMIAVATQQ
ncbi:hypothetical protein CSC79_08550 [Pseudoalteromonas sp. 3D05]|nr:hypothetical protein CSC79_08550 [Pseudoalteromonas sp. 3D05]